MSAACGYCGATDPGAAICAPCGTQLATALERIADLWLDLQDAIGKSLNRQATETHTATAPGIPYNPRAGDLARDTTTDVYDLAHRVARINPAAPEHADTPTAARWLAAHPMTMRLVPNAAQYRGSIVYAARDITATVDHPNRRVDIPGGCPECGAAMHAELRRPRMIVCEGGHQHDALAFIVAR